MEKTMNIIKIISRDLRPYSVIEFTDVSEEGMASILRFEAQAKRELLLASSWFLV
jgi:hypothetical protein